MRKIAAFTIFLIFFLCDNSLFAQDKTFNLFKFGVKGFGGITDTSYLNTMLSDWIFQVVDASNLELENEPVTLPFNIEYGCKPFVIIQPLRFLQIGVKMDYVLSKLTGKFQNPLTNQNYELNFKMYSYSPGVFTYLTMGNLELGGGIFHSYTNILINDDFFGYKDTWFGKNKGYELSLGFSSSREKPVGFTMDLKYRNLFISDLKDNFNRKIVYSNSQENMSLDLSGFILEIGFYFQFIKI